MSAASDPTTKLTASIVGFSILNKFGKISAATKATIAGTKAKIFHFFIGILYYPLLLLFFLSQL
jgi:hypothetical protein